MPVEVDREVECPECKKLVQCYAAHQDVARGEYYNIITWTTQYHCVTPCDTRWVLKESKRDYLKGEAETGPDGLQGRRIGL